MNVPEYEYICKKSQLGAVSTKPKGEKYTSLIFTFRSKALEYEMHIWDAHPSRSLSLSWWDCSRTP